MSKLGLELKKTSPDVNHRLAPADSMAPGFEGSMAPSSAQSMAPGGKYQSRMKRRQRSVKRRQMFVGSFGATSLLANLFAPLFSGGGVTAIASGFGKFAVPLFGAATTALLPEAVEAQGTPGPPGPAGEPGVKGAPGTPGTVGTPGIKGDVGPVGAPGTPGTPGTKGVKGAPGTPGTVGNPGPKGDQGPVGPPGTDGLKGGVGQPGTAGTPGTPGIKGEKGAAGTPGVPGERGFPGTKGVTGAPGTPGTTGTPGVKGEIGFDGVKGAMGFPGTKGERGEVTVRVEGAAGSAVIVEIKGLDGSQGEKGTTGAQGEKGTTGAQGEKGVKGEVGVTGAQGEKGATGAGEKGVKGETGSVGVQGEKGATGAGEKGDQGIKGERGEGGVVFTESSIQETQKSFMKGAPGGGESSQVREYFGDRLQEILDTLGDAPNGGNGGIAGQQTTSTPIDRSQRSPGANLAELFRAGSTAAEQTAAIVVGLDDNFMGIQRNRRQIDINSDLIAGIRKDFGTLRGEAREGTAIALALGGIHLPEGSERAISLRFGEFEGETALAGGGAIRLTDNVTFDFAFSHGFNYSQTGYAAGFTFSW